MVTDQEAPSTFRLAYVPGVMPAKWVRIWHERLPEVPLRLLRTTAAGAAGLLRDRGAEAGLLRLPTDRTQLAAIPLYTETTVVVVPKDHVVAAVDEACAADLAEEILLHPLDDTLDWERPPGRPALTRPETTADAIELVAAGVGLLVVPQSLARLHHRRDLTYRPLSGVPRSTVALSWPQEETTDLVEEFIGIVRGRTVNSSRGRQAAPRLKLTAREKARARRERAKGDAAAGNPARESGKNSAGRATGKKAGKTGGSAAGARARRRSGRARGGGRGRPRRRS